LKGVVKRNTSVAAAGDIIILPVFRKERTGSIPVAGSNARMAKYIRILLLVALSNFLNDAVKQCYFG
jgi:hypothetical protein